MSRSTDRERARLNAPISGPRSTRIADGLTQGRHGDAILYADSDAEAKLKLGILNGGDGPSTNIRDGLTFGDPFEHAAQYDRQVQMREQGQAILDQENRDRQELQDRRERDYLDAVLEAIGDANLNGWRSEELVRDAARAWDSLTPEQRTNLVYEGHVPENVADYLHTQVVPTQANIDAQRNAEVTLAQGRIQKGMALAAIKQERGNPDDQAWNAHAQAVFARARENGIDLSDERMGSLAFDTHFRAAEVALAEDRRAEANAAFQAEVLNASSTDIDMGLTENGVPTFKPLGEIEVKPDYARAMERVLGGANGPASDSAAEIREGIVAAEHGDPEWRRVQNEAGELFAADASVLRKLGEI